MKQKTGRVEKLKRAGTILAIAGGLAIGAAAITHTADDKVEPSENKEYIKELENTAKEMTREQKLQFIRDGKEVLEDLQKTIDSDETNPEERFYAIRSQRLVREEIEVMQKSLSKTR